ncbi:MAG: DUF1294 domain-containing protein [Lachnospiraceae bacterium]|nr:DUF1294 domain-containing protein [Lachnospiraceae bacterium]
MISVWKILLTLWICINVITLVLFGLDKFRAVKDQWRIPEKVLLGWCAAGGAIGGALGMLCFHHKVRKPLFFLGVPAIMILHTVFCIFLLRIYS